MSAKSANCVASFLLAYLRNASAIWLAADDLRWAFAGRVWSRRGAAIVAFPRGGWWERGVSFQRTTGRLGSLTYSNLAGRAAVFCRVAARFSGGNLLPTLGSMKNLTPRRRVPKTVPATFISARTHRRRAHGGRAMAQLPNRRVEVLNGPVAYRVCCGTPESRLAPCYRNPGDASLTSSCPCLLSARSEAISSGCAAQSAGLN